MTGSASPAYKRRAEGSAPPDEGRGSQFETALIMDNLTRDLPEETRRIIPVVLPGRSVEELPTFMRPYSTTHYIVREFSAEGVRDLLAAISGVSEWVKPRRGRYRGNPFAESHARQRSEDAEAEVGRSSRGRPHLLVPSVKLVRSTEGVAIGAADIDGQHYNSSIRFRPTMWCTEPTGVAEFSMGRAYHRFTAVVGVLDDARESDQVGYFQVVLDNVPQSEVRATYGKPVRLTVDVEGVLRLELRAHRPGTVVGALRAGVFATQTRHSLHLPELAWGNPTVTD
ncbi:NPCBM/NEW2 domain-containing protein [Umezawaea sp. Da 62-37]|uniref:NPCBM/NEW2 domain-containing protein n=1 Tax=Umezawaea sp. Da 62-37 TaxID=3075927 RepID=UPI0028F6CC41|nr:NPCBM/NEW2 domain-containing protein [Umezawaea sp. Da 62-37]WNV83904.1 NPCBM/NEW2 domain-containing protein [Umezawaea sp. Da 62-37]